jgi:hypothetical protein
MDIKEIRQKYPQYDDLSDQQLADGLHKKYYSDLPKDDFYKRINLGTTAPATITKKEEPKEEVKTGPTILSDEDTSSDFMRGIYNYLPQLQETYGAAKALTGITASKLGAKETGKSLLESGMESMGAGEAKQVARESDSFTKAFEKGIGTVVTDWLPYQMGAGVANLGETLAAMGIGAGVGALTGAGVGALPGAVAGAVSKTLIKNGVKELAEEVAKKEGKEAAEALVQAEAKKVLVGMGKTAGMVGQAGLHGAGEVTGRAIQEAEKRGQSAEDIDLTRVLPAAFVHGVADFVINKIGLDSLKIGEKASKYLIADITKRIAVTGAKELPAEELQTIAERFGAELSLADAEALTEYIDTAAASFGMSVVPGGIGGARTHMAGKFATLAKEAKENADTQRSATSAENDALETNPVAKPETVAALQPALDENGNALAAAATPTVEATKDATTPTAESVQTTDEAAKEPEKSEAVTAAETYIAEVDAGTKKAHSGSVNKIMTDLGIEKPEGGKGYVERSVRAIKEHIEKQRATSVAGNVSGASGTGAGVAGQPSAVSTTEGATITEPGGMVPTGTVVESTVGGTKEQPVALSEEEQIRAAMELGQQIEKQEAADKEAAYQESLGAGQPAKYNQKNLPEYAQEDYEDLRQTLGEEGVSLPEWGDLTAAEKDIYFGRIKENTIEEREAAARAVADFREQNSEENLSPQQQRIVNGYEEDRKAQGKLVGIEFPAWGELSNAAKLAYLGNIVNNAGTQRERGFEAIADQLEAEGTHVRGVNQAQARDLRLKGTEEERRQAAIDEAEKERALAEEAVGKGAPLDNSVVESLRAGDINGAIAGLVSTAKGIPALKVQRGEKTNDPFVAQLAQRWSKASSFIFQFVARSLSKIKLNSSIVMEVDNPVIQRLRQEGKLAEYDPKTDTFYFTPEGLDEATLLHEVVHAATVKLINTYLTDPSQLTPEQREAMEHLDKIYQFAQKRLGSKYKNAFENLYEFVGYALTDNRFQNDLANMQARSLAKYTLNGENLWKQLTKMFQKLYSLVTAKGTTLEPRPGVYESLVEAFNPKVKEGLYEEAAEGEGEITTEVGEHKDERYQVKGKETEVKETRQKYKQGKRFLVREAGFEGNLMLELSEIFGNILSVPEGGIDMAPLAAKKSGAGQAKKVPALRTADLNKDNPEYDLKSDEVPKSWRFFRKLLGTSPGWQKIATAFQNNRYPIKVWENTLDLAGKIYREGRDKINNIYEQIVLASGDARNFYNVYVSDAANELDKAVGNFARTAGYSTEKALNKLHMISEALHSPERRLVKYLLSVPLSDNKVLTHNGVKISPAERRAQIVKLLDTQPLAKSQAQQLRTELDNLVFSSVANKTPSKYVDGLGSSPRQEQQGGKRKKLPTDINDVMYNATGLDQASVANITAQYNSSGYKAQVDEVLAAMQKLHQATADLNKIANYWSDPVSNRVAFYNFQNYVPLKGNPHHTAVDEELDFDSSKNGREMQDSQGAMDGRISVSKNPVLQTMSDATRAAMRAGRRNLTQSIKNSLKKDKKLNPDGQGILDGYVKKTIKFEERNTVDLKDLKGETTIFHYNQDGSIDILVVSDKKYREAIRQTYKASKPIVDIANKWTSRIGKLHTRYNYQFAPMNFVRDALTNAFTLGAELGPIAAAKFIKEISVMVVANNGLYKALQVAILYEKGDAKSQLALQELAKKDAYVKDMVDFIKTGGMVSYLQGMSLKSNFQDLQKEVGRSGIARTSEQAEKMIDVWTDMFELASRAAAYKIAKQNAMGKGESERAATVRAAAYAKNLANFEQVGDYGKVMGAFYMFFRPAATGAVRAIEAVLPAVTPMSVAVDRLPPVVKNDPVALAKFKQEYSKKKLYASIMSMALFGMGMAAYGMASMSSDDDDLGRNAVATDNMQQWTRFARFHLPKDMSKAMGLGEDVVFQIPWGFGLGAFAASGAQMAAFLAGTQSFTDMAKNIVLQISLDSFIPIPVSRMDPLEDPLNFFLDSVAPSLLRPILEFSLNKNGLGQAIYSDQTRRFGDAYTGGDKIPEIYKQASIYMADSTMGDIDISPNTLYFLSNSYIDGVGRIMENLHGVSDLAQGRKEFNPKTDLPFVGSFFGAKSNVDSREFSKVEKQILDIEKKINMFDTKPGMAMEYRAEHPFNEEIVEIYNKGINNEIKDLRSEAKKLRQDQDMDPAYKRDMLKMIILQENIAKRRLIDYFEMYDIKP